MRTQKNGSSSADLSSQNQSSKVVNLQTGFCQIDHGPMSAWKALRPPQKWVLICLIDRMDKEPVFSEHSTHKPRGRHFAPSS